MLSSIALASLSVAVLMIRFCSVVSSIRIMSAALSFVIGPPSQGVYWIRVAHHRTSTLPARPTAPFHDAQLKRDNRNVTTACAIAHEARCDSLLELINPELDRGDLLAGRLPHLIL